MLLRFHDRLNCLNRNTLVFFKHAVQSLDHLLEGYVLFHYVHSINRLRRLKWRPNDRFKGLPSVTDYHIPVRLTLKCIDSIRLKEYYEKVDHELKATHPHIFYRSDTFVHPYIIINGGFPAINVATLATGLPGPMIIAAMMAALMRRHPRPTGKPALGAAVSLCSLRVNVPALCITYR